MEVCLKNSNAIHALIKWRPRGALGGIGSGGATNPGLAPLGLKIYKWELEGGWGAAAFFSKKRREFVDVRDAAFLALFFSEAAHADRRWRKMKNINE